MVFLKLNSISDNLPSLIVVYKLYKLRHVVSYSAGFLQLLSLLTKVGDVTREMFLSKHNFT